MAKRSKVRIWYLDAERKPGEWDCQFYDARTSPGCLILMLGTANEKPERRKMIPYATIRDIDVITYEAT